MVGRSGFTADEWRDVGGAPFTAPAFIVASGPHRAVATVRNMLTAAKAFMLQSDTSNMLITDARADGTGPNGDPGSTAHTPENIARLRATLTRVADLLDAKGRADADGYKRELLRIGTAAALASRDGVLGISGNALNEYEDAALTELAKILAIPR